MKKMKTYFASLVCLCLLSGVLPSCTKEIGGAEDEPEIVVPPVDEDPQLEAISIRIGAAETAETKAMHGDENAVEGEFIHSLHLFIVGHDTEKRDTIARHIIVNSNESEGLTNDQKQELQKGNLPQYATTIENILPGSYTFYAFANMGNAKAGTENASVDELLSKMTEGSAWSGIDNLVINDPAASVNLAEGQYIPMSVKQDVELTVDGQQINLSLVRLVSKVRATLYNERGNEVKVMKLQMVGTYAKSVTLFPSDTHEAGTDQTIYTKDFGSNPISIAHNGSHTFDEIYINETFGSSFTLGLTIDGNEYEGVLQTKDVSRNHVLPVALNLKNTNLVLAITADVAPIGGYPITVYTGAANLTNDFKVTLPEGCTFTIQGTFTPEVGEPVSVEQWTWTVPSAYTSIVQLESSTGDETGNWICTENPLSGYLTSLSGQTADLGFLVSLPNRLQGTLTIETTQLGDYNTRSLTQWGEAPRWYEAVGLVKRPSAPGFNPEQ